MEFFEFVNIKTEESCIQDVINPDNIDLFCPSMFLIDQSNNYFKMGTAWGEFLVSYDKIMGGVRFALLDCPNALSITITTGYPPERSKITLHVTINRTQKPPSFIEELMDFLQDWHDGLTENFKQKTSTK